jgi:polyhydroxyalkanoate synthase subunit PhaC
VSGRSDSIAPPPLAQPLGRLIPHASTVEAPTGHVGMVVGSLARAQVWRPIAAFLAQHGPGPKPVG